MIFKKKRAHHFQNRHRRLAVSGNRESKKRLTQNIIPDKIIRAQDGITNSIMLDFKSLSSTRNAFMHAQCTL
jgi:hypothetical protein